MVPRGPFGMFFVWDLSMNFLGSDFYLQGGKRGPEGVQKRTDLIYLNRVEQVVIQGQMVQTGLGCSCGFILRNQET